MTKAKEPAQRLHNTLSCRVNDDDKQWLDTRARELTSTLPRGAPSITASDVLRMCLAEKRERETKGDRYVSS